MAIKLPRFNKISALKYLSLVFVTALTLCLIVFALPQTEKMLKFPKNNLNISDNKIWEKTFISEIDLEGLDNQKKWNQVNAIKNNIYQRLANYGVEMVNITYEDSDKTGKIITKVRSTLDPTKVQSLISQNGNLKVVIKKDEANFENESDPYAAFLPSNYNDSNISKTDLRTIYVTRLKTTTDEYAYFGILKPWVWNSAKYDKFLKDNSGKDGGINLDGFVTPTSLPVYSGSSSSTQTAKPFISYLVSKDFENAKVQEVVLNSTPLPPNYSFKEAVDNSVTRYDYSYTTLYILIASVVILIAYKLIFKGEVIQTLITMVISLSTYIAYLKLSQVEILSTSILLGSSIAYIFILIYGLSKEKLFVLLPSITTLFLMSFLVKTHFVLFAPTTLYLIILIVLIYPLVQRYLLLFKSTFRK